MAITYHSGRRIQGTSTDFGTAGAGIPAVAGGWKELGRTTLGGTGNTITVSSLADKRYYMVLVNSLATGATPQGSLRLGNSTAATSGYSGRYSRNGAADATNLNAASMTFEGYVGATTPNVLGTAYISNLSSKEKLLITNTVRAGATGAATAPDRQENATKWAYTSNPLDLVQLYNTNTSTFASGSEVVVLGWDPEDTHTDNFWEELASVDLSGGAADILDSGTFTAKKYLWGQVFLESSSTITSNTTFNADTGANYARRYSADGAADATSVSQNYIRWFGGAAAATNVFYNFFIINNSGNEKLLTGNIVNANTAGAGNAPKREEIAGKWANTAEQISKITFTNPSAGSYGTNSIMKVWGSD